MALSHSCPDGKHSRLERSGPVGTMVGVAFTCARCGHRKDAQRIHADAVALMPIIVKALASRS